ncbi:hypothetical protein F5B21DRAFT_489161 [Xylaria acuta]|nr:hypothetical protein F5B21DRAFT_489161 [Xylaria acuta]
MSSAPSQEQSNHVVVVDSNNFHQVLLFFNEHGDLANATTRIGITRTICVDKHLAIVNLGQDEVTADLHESHAMNIVAGPALPTYAPLPSLRTALKLGVNLRPSHTG